MLSFCRDDTRNSDGLVLTKPLDVPFDGHVSVRPGPSGDLAGLNFLLLFPLRHSFEDLLGDPGAFCNEVSLSTCPPCFLPFAFLNGCLSAPVVAFLARPALTFWL